MDERGSVPVSVGIGFLILMICLFIAVHVLMVLYARSVVTTAGYEAARYMATHDGAGPDAARARAQSFTSLHLDVDPADDGDTVQVRVRTRAPGFYFGLDSLRTIDVRVRVRKERFRPDGAP